MPKGATVTNFMFPAQIKMGSYAPLPQQYSQELKLLIASMLSVSPTRRPTVNQILRTPIIKSRIEKFLSETCR